MKIEKIEDLHADGGWQKLSFLKVTASDGQVGWAEFGEGFAPGQAAVIRAQAPALIGRDPRDLPSISHELLARARPAAGAGARMGVMLDLNFNFKPEGVRRLAAALDPLGLEWLEMDGIDPLTLAELRRGIKTPIASLEAQYGRAGILPYLEARAVDVAVIDPMWNGLAEAVRMAGLCEAFQVNVASHQFSGALATAMCAHFCAVVPNLRIMEVDLDRVPWHDRICKGAVDIRDGHALVPEGMGWGIEPDEGWLDGGSVTEP